jgi:phage virion morphogenesis protein
MFTHRLNESRVVEALARAAQHNSNTEPLMGQIAGIMHFEVEENFEAGGRPKWVPLAASTIAQRTEEGTWPGQVLQRSGGLGTSILPQHDATTARVGTNKEYAAILHEGGEIKRTAKGGKGKKSKARSWTIKIPGRPYLVVSPAGIERILQAVKRFILGPTG